MHFSAALHHIKDGQRLTRRNWNGANQWLILVPGSEITVEANRPLGIAAPELVGKRVEYRAHIDIKTMDDELVPWIASQTDLLADDWEIVSA